MLSPSAQTAKALLPALELLDHSVAVADLDAGADAAFAVTAANHSTAPAAGGSGAGVSHFDVVVVDATTDLARASAACRTIAAADDSPPILVVVSTGGLAALKRSWGFDDWLLPEAVPAEVETRLRLLADRATAGHVSRAASIGDLVIDDDTYVVRLKGRPLDLTFREFELLKYLANNPGRVFTRGQLLQEVWGYDYYGGTRTVDVHIRRLRAKLGAEHEHVIGTVRGVGYKLDPQGTTT